jgi:hypothetical protein
MTFHGGRPALILLYGLLGISGFLAQPSGFVALIALPIELLFLILLYSLRPERLHRSPYPSASAVLGGSVPLFLFYWFIAAAVGSAMDNVVPEPGHDFLLSPFVMNDSAIAGVIMGYIIAFAMEFRALRKHPDAWSHFPQRLVAKGSSIWILAYVGIAAVMITGEEHQEWAIACLIMGRIAVEFALRPLDNEGIGVWRN